MIRAPGGEAILTVEQLSVRFGALKAVDGVSFEARRGAITAVIGPNGAGKSTLFNLVSGAIRPQAGRVRLDGQDITGQAPQRLLAAGLARNFQITNLFFELPVRENLRLAAQFVEAGPWWRGLRHVQHSHRALQRVDELIEQFELQRDADEAAGALSHGQQRRLEMAMALASRPRLLMLDEPTQGMSHADTQEAAELIRRLVADGLSVLLVEHDVDLVMALSDHVVVMHQGAKLAEGTPQSVRADRAVQAAYFGEESGHA